MGLFDCMCAESGLIIDSRQRLIPIVETAPGTWEPLALPIAGTYDRYGTMDPLAKSDGNIKIFVELARSFAYRYEEVKPAKLALKDVLDEIRGDGSGATWKDRAVSFALIDAAVFDAIVAAVKANSATAWIRYAKLGLREPELPLPGREPTESPRPAIDATTERLCRALLEKPDDDATRKVYVDHLLERDDPQGRLLAALPTISKLPVGKLFALALPHTSAAYLAANTTPLLPWAIELLRFRAWGTRLVPACGEGQIMGYEARGEKYAQYTDWWAKPYAERARQKYARMPELLAAVDRNERAFRERGKLTDDDDE